MSGAEAVLVLGVISSCITLVDASRQLLEAARNTDGLPEDFQAVKARMPLIAQTLKNARTCSEESSNEDQTAARPLLQNCARDAGKLKDLLQKVMVNENDGLLDRYTKQIRALNKGHKVEVLAQKILQQLQGLLANHVFANIATTKELQEALLELQNVQSSIGEGDTGYHNYGTGPQSIAHAGSNQINHTYSGNFSTQGSMHIGPGKG